MAIDLTLIQDTDWLVCTDEDGVTKKVSGANFKELFGILSTFSGTVEIPSDNFDFKLIKNNISSSLQNTNACTIDWGDGTSIEDVVANDDELTHTYASSGTYQIVISSTDGQTAYGAISPTDTPSANCWTKFGPMGVDFVNRAGLSQINLKMNSLTDWDYLSQFDFSTITSISQAWFGATSIATPFPLVDTSAITDNGFQSSWQNCYLMPDPFPQIDISNANNFTSTWMSCRALTSFPPLDFSNAINLTRAWRDCKDLTSFPPIVPSKVTDFEAAWQDCESLTSFPKLDFSAAEIVIRAWSGCEELTPFPAIDMPNVTTCEYAWRNCKKLTSFPLVDFSKVITFKAAWFGCTLLTDLPPNSPTLGGLFDTTGALETDAFQSTFTNVPLSVTSVESLLVSLDTNGASNVILDMAAAAPKSTWTAAANAAFDSLELKGWTITYTP